MARYCNPQHKIAGAGAAVAAVVAAGWCATDRAAMESATQAAKHVSLSQGTDRSKTTKC